MLELPHLLTGTELAAYDGLRGQFASREVRKFYWAVVKGEPPRNPGKIVSAKVAADA